MKVNVWKNVDIECEVEVQLTDILLEWSERLEKDQREGHKNRVYLGTIDFLTRLIERIPKEVFDQLTEEQWAVIRPRIENLLSRDPAVKQFEAGA